MSRIDWLGLGYVAMGTLLAAFLFLIAGGIALIPLIDPTEPAWPVWLVALFSASLGVAYGGAYIATGVGLGARQRWARVAGLVLGVLSLQSAPFGTALGAFSLFALLDEDAAGQFV